jgi:hypothetical protein
MRSSGV